MTSDVLRVRFTSKYKVDQVTGCWIWSGTITDDGYGRFWVRDRQEGAHRFSVRLSGRDIPKGMHVDHLCRVRNCVNPDHLEVVTHQENIRRGVGPGKVAAALQRAKTHCPQGHAYTAENIRPGSKGKHHRLCKTCHRTRESLRYHAKMDGLKQPPKTHCPSGHEYAGDNLYVSKTGGRECRTCMRENQRIRRARYANR